MRWMTAFTQSPEGKLWAHEDLSDDVAAVAAAVGAMQSATVLINSFAARQQAAIDQALENGATAAELKPLTDLQASVVAETANLAQAVATNS
jgi:hypothetical protein